MVNATHTDPAFCREMGEQIITICVGANVLLKSNGSQGNVYRNNHKVAELRNLGRLTARNLINRGALTPAGRLTDLLCVVSYPKRMHRVDPPNMWPTCKPLIDGFTEAGVWADDDSTHIRRTAFQQHPEPTGRKGLWRVEFHIIPVTEEEQ